MNRPSALSVCYGLSIILAFAGTALMVAPSPAYSVPVFAARENTSAPAAPTAREVRSEYANLFDLTALPAPIASPIAETEAVSPDPAEALRIYRYLGGAHAGERNAALFETGGAVSTLRLGETLADFTLNSFDGRHASFRKGDFEASLPLTEP